MKILKSHKIVRYLCIINKKTNKIDIFFDDILQKMFLNSNILNIERHIYWEYVGGRIQKSGQVSLIFRELMRVLKTF